VNTRRSPVRRLVAACALALLTTSPALARQMATWQGLAGWTAVPEIVGQTSTATVAGGGNPLYIPPVPQYSGAVGLRMDYGAGGAFVCSGSLIGPMTILTAAHCVSDGTDARPNSVTAYFYNGTSDPSVYAGTSPEVTLVNVASIVVNPLYSGEVVDQNDIAVLNLAQMAPAFAPVYQLSGLTDLTSVNHIIAGYGVRSDTGGSVGSNLGTGRLRYAGNRFDFRFGDADFQGYFDGAFGAQATEHVWISDFDNGTAFRDGSCNVAIFEAANAPAIFGNPVFTSDKYCNTGIGAFEGIGGGGDSGSGYFVDGQVAAVHSFALWYRDDESQNRFGQLKGAVPVYQHLDFINAAMVPEPGTWAMMLGGIGLLAGWARRQRATPAA
jgi:hypothetical protein